MAYLSSESSFTKGVANTVEYCLPLEKDCLLLHGVKALSARTVCMVAMPVFATLSIVYQAVAFVIKTPFVLTTLPLAYHWNRPADLQTGKWLLHLQQITFLAIKIIISLPFALGLASPAICLNIYRALDETHNRFLNPKTSEQNKPIVQLEDIKLEDIKLEEIKVEEIKVEETEVEEPGAFKMTNNMFAAQAKRLKKTKPIDIANPFNQVEGKKDLKPTDDNQLEVSVNLLENAKFGLKKVGLVIKEEAKKNFFEIALDKQRAQVETDEFGETSDEFEFDGQDFFSKKSETPPVTPPSAPPLSLKQKTFTFKAPTKTTVALPLDDIKKHKFQRAEGAKSAAESAEAARVASLARAKKAEEEEKAGANTISIFKTDKNASPLQKAANTSKHNMIALIGARYQAIQNAPGETNDSEWE